jgi:ABC-type multidrug transport system ATPase subunit
MLINLSGVGKRYNYDWIFRRLDYQFLPDRSYAILGHNGSGKSTLLSILSGYLSSSEGSITYQLQGRDLPVEQLFQHLSFTAPYQELIEEFTLTELIDYHSRFKKMLLPSTQALIERLYLEKARHKFIKDFSSGMKQRLKLGLAIYTESPLLLLDEPTTNLDEEGVNWYLEHVACNRKDRLVVVSSNVTHEYAFCDEQIRITDFHPQGK